MSILCTEFRAQLKRADLTQSEFARLIGVTFKAVNNWCNGRQPVPIWAWALSRAFAELPPDYLVELPDFGWQDVLGITLPAQAKSARARLAKIYHPDIGGDVASMQRINAAYEQATKTQKTA